MTESKSTLRAQQRALLASLCAAQADDADLICHAAATYLQRFASIAFFQPLADELSPLPLAATLATTGTIIAMPRVIAKNAPLVFHRWQTDDRLVPDALDLRAPQPNALTVMPALIVAPLLAFDRTGNRLGRGGGYYDRTVSQLRAAGHSFAYAGFGFAEQQVPRLPAEPHDARLDFVITPAGILTFSVIDKST